MERFAFLLHPLRVNDLKKKFTMLKPVPDSMVERMFSKVPPFKVSKITGVVSATGIEAEGYFIALPLTPRMLMEMPWPKVKQKLIAAGHLAEDLGAEILGLGAFTKVVGDRGISVNEALRIPVTTGNSYTAATSVETALMGASRIGHDLTNIEATVIGASGAIGRAVSLLLAEKVGKIRLVARHTGPLEAVKNEIERTSSAEVTVDTDVRQSVKNSQMVLTVSSATDVLLHPEDLRSGSVVCDVARPRNVSRAVKEKRQDVLVVDGGVIAVPGPVNFNFDFGFPQGMAEACIAETMILALSKRYEPFSLGSELSLSKTREIMQLGTQHGFEVAGFRRFEEAISDDEIEKIRSHYQRTDFMLA